MKAKKQTIHLGKYRPGKVHKSWCGRLLTQVTWTNFPRNCTCKSCKAAVLAYDKRQAKRRKF